jgi:5-(carboxyamino)imidazole ribonucleotide mutase
MSKILIVFGSKSDEVVYDNIVTELKKNPDVHYEMRICSAHRTPEELIRILNDTDADVIIAGAGLAAHLPGVVASKTVKPIIGVPVSGNYQGLDALLSIMQMPPGIPVMSVGVDKAAVAAKLSAKMLKEYKTVHIFGDEDSKAVKKATDIFESMDIKYEMNPDFEANSLNIRFVELDMPAEERDDLIIYVPLLSKDDDNAEAALNVLKNSTNGLWVGLNRGDNAALAAAEILSIKNHELREKLKEHRKKGAEKVKKHDEEVNKK